MSVNFIRYVWELSPAWARRRFGSALMGVYAAYFPSAIAEAYWRMVRLRWLLEEETTDDQLEEETRFRGLETHPFQGGTSLTPGAKESRTSAITRAKSAFVTWKGDYKGGLMTPLVDALSRICGVGIYSIDIIAESTSTASYVSKTGEIIFPGAAGYLIAIHVPESFEAQYVESFMGDTLPFTLGSGISRRLSGSIERAVNRFSPAESKCRAVYLITASTFPLKPLFFTTFEARRGWLTDTSSWFSPDPVAGGTVFGNRDISTAFIVGGASLDSLRKWLTLDGVDGEISVGPPTSAIAEPFTFFSHFKNLLLNGGDTYILESNAGNGLTFRVTSGNYELQLVNTTVGFDETIVIGACNTADGGEHTLLLYLDGGTAYLYEDGVLQYSVAYVSDMVNTPSRIDVRETYDLSLGGVPVGPPLAIWSSIGSENTSVSIRRFAYGFTPVNADQVRELHRTSLVNENPSEYYGAIDPDWIARDWNAYYSNLKEGADAGQSLDFTFNNRTPGSGGVVIGTPFKIESPDGGTTVTTVDTTGFDYLLVLHFSALNGAIVTVNGVTWDPGGGSDWFWGGDDTTAAFAGWALRDCNRQGNTSVTVSTVGGLGDSVTWFVPVKNGVVVDWAANGDSVAGATDSYVEPLEGNRKGIAVAACAYHGSANLSFTNSVQLLGTASTTSQSVVGSKQVNLNTVVGCDSDNGALDSSFLAVVLGVDGSIGDLPPSADALPTFNNRLEFSFNREEYTYYNKAVPTTIAAPTGTGVVGGDPAAQHGLIRSLSQGAATFPVSVLELFEDDGVFIGELDATIEWYGYVPELTNATNLISTDTPHVFRLRAGQDSGFLYFDYRHEGVTGVPAWPLLVTDIEPGSFVHIVVARVAGSAYLFVNGELHQEVSGFSAPDTLAAAINVGDDSVPGLRTVFARILAGPVSLEQAKGMYLNALQNSVNRGFGWVVPINPGVEEPITASAFDSGFNEGFE